MGKSYSADLRERVIGFIETGRSRRQAALRFGVSPSFAVKLMSPVEHRIEHSGKTRPPSGRRQAWAPRWLFNRARPSAARYHYAGTCRRA